MDSLMATSFWPWAVVAGLGALHGLNPATGWPLAAAWALRSRNQAQAWRALLPMALGHGAAVALAVGAVVWGRSFDRTVLLVLAGTLCAVVAVVHLWRRTPQAARAPAGHAGLALWSFMMATVHGAGLMLVPALVPLCGANALPADAIMRGSLPQAVAAVALHMVAMLAVSGAVGSGVCRGLRQASGQMQGKAGHNLGKMCSAREMQDSSPAPLNLSLFDCVHYTCSRYFQRRSGPAGGPGALARRAS